MRASCSYCVTERAASGGAREPLDMPERFEPAPETADLAVEVGRVEAEMADEPPADEPPGPHFALLAKIAARNGLARLSMGMSGDFETAVRFGATSVRVGSALFGARAG